MEIIAMEEEFAKKASFTDIVQWMIKQTAGRDGKPAEGGGGCCGGNEPMTPDGIVTSFMPKLTETMLEILSETPFNASPTLPSASGSQFKFRGETILTTLLAFERRVLGGKPEHRRNITIEAPTSAKLNSSFTVSVKCEKLPFVKDGPGASRRSFYVALCNLGDNSMTLRAISGVEPSVEQKFTYTVKEKGDCSFRAFVVSGDGQIESGKDGKVTIE